MDYNLQKLITPSLPFKLPQSYLRPDQAIDYVNPGLGNISRLYSFYVPFPNLGKPEEITKIEQKNSSQEGFGQAENTHFETKESNTGPSTSVETNENILTAENKIHSSAPIDPDIKESFQHPKIRVSEKTFAKLSSAMKFDDKKTSKISKSTVSVASRSGKPETSHKFQFFD